MLPIQAEALIAAKNEIVALREAGKAKEAQLVALQQALRRDRAAGSSSPSTPPIFPATAFTSSSILTDTSVPSRALAAKDVEIAELQRIVKQLNNVCGSLEKQLEESRQDFRHAAGRQAEVSRECEALKLESDSFKKRERESAQVLIYD
jgi:hypothetical protein